MRDSELNELLMATTAGDVEKVIERLSNRIEWVPLGGNAGNYGIISMGADPYDGITERITNAIDAMIELQVELRPELKRTTSPRKAVEAIYELKDGKLRWCEQRRIGELASHIKVKFMDSESSKRPTIEIQDQGIGQHPLDFPATLLGLNEDYKVSKLYLMGAFGQGGQTSFAHCTYGIIVSRKESSLLKAGRDDLVGWSIVRYRDMTTPDVIFKRGRWEYCVEAGTRRVPTCDPREIRIAFEHGTLIRLVSYDLPKGTSDVLQPASTAWSFLSQSLFDPLLPMRLYESRVQYENRNRALAGLANRLWSGGRGDKAQIWSSDSYELRLGTRGSVTINYWALSPADELENWRDIKKGYVSGNHAIYVTLNGQRHGVEQTTFLRDRVNLTYSHDYLIVQVDCDGLTNQSKKELLSSTRDRLKEGEFKEDLMEEVAQHLRQDRNVLAFERDRKVKILSARSERDTSKIRSLVGRYIGQNPELAELILARGKEPLEGQKQKKQEREYAGPEEIREEELDRPDLKPIPTYLRITNVKDPIPIEKGGNSLVRLETDAVDSYFESDWDSHFRGVHKTGLTIRRSSSRLRNGKISYFAHCPPSGKTGTQEELRFELDLPDGSVLAVERSIVIVPPFERKKEPGEEKLPEPRIFPVSKADNAAVWAAFGWDERSVGKVVIEKAKPEDSGIYVSLDNLNLAKALRRRKLEADVSRAVEDRYLAGVAFYLLLRKVHEIKGKSLPDSEPNGSSDSSAELDRVAQVVSVLSLPIEAL
ncbi:MAG TPA: hypothetical protein VF992_10815 [Thermoplasmata archaeon]